MILSFKIGRYADERKEGKGRRKEEEVEGEHVWGTSYVCAQ